MLEHTLPPVLAEVQRLAAAPPVDTEPLQHSPRLFDLCDHDLIRVSGRDRIRFLHAMLSNDVASLSVGEGRWATFNTAQGRTVSDARLLVIDEDAREGSLLVILEPGARDAFVDGLDRYIISDKVYFEDADDSALWLVAGAGAEEAVTATGAALPGPSTLDHRMTELGGRPVRVIRLDRSGPQGDDLALWMAADDAPAVLAALAHVERGDRTLLEAARIEAGQPRFGIDLTEDNIPLESGLKDRAISFTKGCYIGQEVICRIDSMGSPKRLLCRLDVQEGGAPAPGTPLHHDGKAVGHVTSAVVSAALGRPVALGYVKKRHNEPGTTLELPDGRTATIRDRA